MKLFTDGCFELFFFFAFQSFQVCLDSKFQNGLKQSMLRTLMIIIMSGSKGRYFLVSVFLIKCKVLTLAKIPLHSKNGLFWN